LPMSNCRCALGHLSPASSRSLRNCWAESVAKPAVSTSPKPISLIVCSVVAGFLCSSSLTAYSCIPTGPPSGVARRRPARPQPRRPVTPHPAVCARKLLRVQERALTSGSLRAQRLGGMPLARGQQRGEIRVHQSLIEGRQISLQDLLEVHVNARPLAFEGLQ